MILALGVNARPFMGVVIRMKYVHPSLHRLPLSIHAKREAYLWHVHNRRLVEGKHSS